MGDLDAALYSSSATWTAWLGRWGSNVRAVTANALLSLALGFGTWVATEYAEHRDVVREEIAAGRQAPDFALPIGQFWIPLVLALVFTVLSFAVSVVSALRRQRDEAREDRDAAVGVLQRYSFTVRVGAQRPTFRATTRHNLPMSSQEDEQFGRWFEGEVPGLEIVNKSPDDTILVKLALIVPGLETEWFNGSDILHMKPGHPYAGHGLRFAFGTRLDRPRLTHDEIRHILDGAQIEVSDASNESIPTMFIRTFPGEVISPDLSLRINRVRRARAREARQGARLTTP